MLDGLAFTVMPVSNFPRFVVRGVWSVSVWQRPSNDMRMCHRNCCLYLHVLSAMSYGPGRNLHEV